MNRLVNIQRNLLVVLMAWALCGCAELSRPADDFSDKPVPYSIGVFFDAESSALPEPVADPEEELELPRFQYSGEEIAQAVAQILEDEQIASTAVAVEFASRADAAKTKAYDYVLAVSTKAPEDFGEAQRSIGCGVMEIASWLFGGLPSWFVSTVRYEAKTQMAFHLADPNVGTGGSAGFGVSAESDIIPLSLWTRSEEPEHYALSIVVPPMFILPRASAAEGEMVTRSVVDSVGRELAGIVKQELIRRELESDLRVAFITPCSGSELSEIPTLVLEIVTRGGVALRALDVHRHAQDETPFRWLPSADELARINESIGSVKPDRVRFPVPVNLPLVDGENVIRVRAQRTDGVRVTRTVVFQYEEK